MPDTDTLSPEDFQALHDVYQHLTTIKDPRATKVGAYLGVSGLPVSSAGRAPIPTTLQKDPYGIGEHPQVLGSPVLPGGWVIPSAIGYGTQHGLDALGAPPWASIIGGLAAGGVAGIPGVQSFARGALKAAPLAAQEGVLGWVGKPLSKLVTGGIEAVKAGSKNAPATIEKFVGPADELAGGVNAPLRPPVKPPTPPPGSAIPKSLLQQLPKQAPQTIAMPRPVEVQPEYAPPPGSNPLNPTLLQQLPKGAPQNIPMPRPISVEPEATLPAGANQFPASILRQLPKNAPRVAPPQPRMVAEPPPSSEAVPVSLTPEEEVNAALQKARESAAGKSRTMEPSGTTKVNPEDLRPPGVVVPPHPELPTELRQIYEPIALRSGKKGVELAWNKDQKVANYLIQNGKTIEEVQAMPDTELSQYIRAADPKHAPLSESGSAHGRKAIEVRPYLTTVMQYLMRKP